MTFHLWETDTNNIAVPNSDMYEYDSILGQVTYYGRTAMALYNLINGSADTGYLAYDANGKLLLFTDTAANGGANIGEWVEFAGFRLANEGVGARDSLLAGASAPTMLEIYMGSPQVTVPAGTFTNTCWLHDTSGVKNINLPPGLTGSVSDSKTNDLYFASGVGLIRLMTFSTDTTILNGNITISKQGLAWNYNPTR
jgi:hypothetical protein